MSRVVFEFETGRTVVLSGGMVLGLLTKTNLSENLPAPEWFFVGSEVFFAADELRHIADKLDDLNGVTPAAPEQEPSHD